MEDAPPKTEKRWPWHHRSVRHILTLCALLLLIAGAIEGYRRMERFNRHKLQAKLLKEETQLAFEFINFPEWLDKDFVNSFREEAQFFSDETVPAKAAAAPIANYFRLLNPLMENEVAPDPHGQPPEVLRELAQHFHNRAAEHNNAWIEKIDSVSRAYDPQRNIQRILISAQFRRPSAFIAQGNSYFLIDSAGTRLPGEYSEQDRKLMPGLLVISHVDEPVPAPGEALKTPEAATALKLVKLLADQPYASQIAAINMTNYDGRTDKMAPHILLDTTYQTSIWWGRLPEKDDFREVTPKAKLNALATIFAKYNRIDAEHPYVDIRFEEARVPLIVNNTSTEVAPPAPSHPAPSAAHHAARG